MANDGNNDIGTASSIAPQAGGDGGGGGYDQAAAQAQQQDMMRNYLAQMQAQQQASQQWMQMPQQGQQQPQQPQGGGGGGGFNYSDYIAQQQANADRTNAFLASGQPWWMYGSGPGGDSGSAGMGGSPGGNFGGMAPSGGPFGNPGPAASPNGISPTEANQAANQGRGTPSMEGYTPGSIPGLQGLYGTPSDLGPPTGNIGPPSAFSFSPDNVYGNMTQGQIANAVTGFMNANNQMGYTPGFDAGGNGNSGIGGIGFGGGLGGGPDGGYGFGIGPGPGGENSPW